MSHTLLKPSNRIIGPIHRSLMRESQSKTNENSSKNLLLLSRIFDDRIARDRHDKVKQVNKKKHRYLNGTSKHSWHEQTITTTKNANEVQEGHDVCSMSR